MENPPNYQHLKSPYLDLSSLPIDDRYVYIPNQQHSRGRLENSFIQIGSMVMFGATIGAIRGFIEGREMAHGYPESLKNTIILNHINKSAQLGNTLGIITLMYAASGTALEKLRGKDDYANTILASTTTGYIYKMFGGWRAMVYGGATGFGLGTMLALWQGRIDLLNEWKYVLHCIKNMFY